MPTYIAKTLFGLEPVLAREIEAIGGKEIEPLNRAVQFQGDRSLLYRANYQLRTALRILVPMRSFRCRNEEELYRQIQLTDWSKLMTLQDTFAIDAVVKSSFFRHSKYPALKTKDAIADQFRSKFDQRPSVDVESPSLRINLHIFEDKASLSLDSSGNSLHKRGYRTRHTGAPLNEVLAAGMLYSANWPDYPLFLDPMCGSGTLLIEGAMIARRIPPQINRHEFGFFHWKDFDAALWQQVKKDVDAQILEECPAIVGGDKDPGALRVARRNAQKAGVSDNIELWNYEFDELPTAGENGLIIMNPPYDERMGVWDIEELYASIGDQLKQHYSGFDAWIISSSKEGLKRIGLRPSRKMTLFNGALECKYQKYELYKGSKKASKQ
jgi:putative N6-adenine-specific DNA methylase